MQNPVETKHVPEGTKQSPNGLPRGAPPESGQAPARGGTIEADYEVRTPGSEPAPAGKMLMGERLEKMREGVRNLKAQRDGLRAEIASMERDLEQVNDAVLRNEGALAMIQQLVQEEGGR